MEAQTTELEPETFRCTLLVPEEGIHVAGNAEFGIQGLQAEPAGLECGLLFGDLLLVVLRRLGLSQPSQRLNLVVLGRGRLRLDGEIATILPITGLKELLHGFFEFGDALLELLDLSFQALLGVGGWRVRRIGGFPRDARLRGNNQPQDGHRHTNGLPHMYRVFFHSDPSAPWRPSERCSLTGGRLARHT